MLLEIGSEYGNRKPEEFGGGKEMLTKKLINNLFVAAIVALLISLAPQIARAQQKTAQEYFDEGMNYFGAKKYREAIESLTKATKAKPDYVEAFTPLGIAYIQLEMYEEAIAPLREAIRLEPPRGLSHGALGQAYSNVGRNKEAAAEFKEAARLEPAQGMWRDGLKDAMDALDAPPYDFIKQEAEKLWRLNNPVYLKDAANVAFKYRSIGVKRQPKGVLRPAGTGSAGNSIEPLYSSDIKLTASVTYSKPSEYVVDYQEEDHLCFYKKTGETPWSAALCERATKDFVKVDPKVLDEYVGQYQMPATEFHQAFVLTVSREGEKLISEANGLRAEFLPRSDNEFYMKEEDVELRFVRDAQGKVTHIDWGGTIVKRIN
jgi:tetratricopeptide (TPR) repeat protein